MNKKFFLSGIILVMILFNVSFATSTCLHISRESSTSSATCTSNSVTTTKCSSCGLVISKVTNNGTLLGHNYGSYKTLNAATCIEKGDRYRECTRCGTKDYSYDSIAINPDNHNPEIYYEYQNSSQCRRKCTLCNKFLNNAVKHVIVGDSTGLHYCNLCNTKANGTNGWPKYHYYPSGLNCDYCGGGGLAISSTNFSGLPKMNDYYMIGSGKAWEKPQKNIEITYNYTPYSNAANTSYISGVYVNLVSFVHGNWAFHAGKWSEGDNEDTTITEWPIANITKPLGQWSGPVANWSQSSNNKVTLTHSSGKTYKSGALPNGHWQILNTYANNTLLTTDYRMFLNGSCNGEAPNEIPGFVVVGYRDKNGNKISGAPSDLREKRIVWTDHDHGASYPATANHTKLDSLGWRYVGYRVYKKYNIPKDLSGASETGSSKSVTVYPKLGDQKYAIVFIYEPIKVTITHLNKATNQTIKSDKNGTFKLPDIISGKIEVSSFSKTVWPAYILNETVVSRKVENKKTKTVKYTYSTKEEDRNKIDVYTTRLEEKGDTEEVKQKIDQKIIKLTSQSPIPNTVGKGNDIDVKFYYSTLTLNVRHLNIDGTPIKDISNKYNLEYTIPLKAHKVNEPSLVVDGEEHQLTQKISGSYRKYKFDGILDKVEIYKENKKIGEIDNDIIGYGSSWIYSTANLANKELEVVSREIAKLESNISIIFYYKRVPILTIKHIEDSYGLLLERPEKILMEKTEMSVAPKDFSDSGYTNIRYEPSGDKKIEPKYNENMEPIYNSGDLIVKNDGISKTVVFVYSYKSSQNPEEQIRENNNGDKEELILRSNKKGDEEYEVDSAIPTSEDLYTEVIANSFVLKKNIQEMPKEKTMRVTLWLKYFMSIDDETTVEDVEKVKLLNKKGDSYTFEISFPYTYWTAEGSMLKNIEEAIVKNKVISPNGEVIVNPNDEYRTNLPKFVYEPGGKLEFNTDAISNDDVLNAKSGFYNYKEKDGIIYVDLLLDEDQYEKVESVSTKSKEIIQKYENDPRLLLEIAEKDSKAKVSSDKLSVTYNGEEFIIMKGVKTQIGKTYTVKELEQLGIAYINSEPNIVVKNETLYKKDGIYVKKDIANNTSNGYNTTADVDYVPYEVIRNSAIDRNITEEEKINNKETRELTGNPVKVHTPVVNDAKLELEDNNEHKQKELSGNVIVIGEDFSITIPHSGSHNSYKGYGGTKNAPKVYNYNGLNANVDVSKVNYDSGLFTSQEKREAFAKKKLIKFEFGVLYSGIDTNKKYVKNTNNGIYELKDRKGEEAEFSVNDPAKESIYFPANTWFEVPLNVEEYTFVIPTWEAEKWNNQIAKIYTKVVAENISANLLKTETDGQITNDRNYINSRLNDISANTDPANYIAYKNFDVKIIGKMYDIQIRATNDPGFANLATNDPNKGLTAAQFPLGEVGTNKASAYKYGLKLGAKVFFDLKVYGSTAETNPNSQTSNNIVAEPLYYYVSKTGEGLTKNIDLYYHTTKERYVKMDATNSIKFSAKMPQNYGIKYFPNYNTNLGLTNQILGNTFNYATTIVENGNSSLVKLGARTRIVAYRTPAELIKIVFGKDKINFVPNASGVIPTNNQIINSVGRWYGEFRIPASTIVVKKDGDPKLATDILKDGYIIVAFENLRTLNGDTLDYLSYEKPTDSAQWIDEGYNNIIKLPNGATQTVSLDSKHYAMAIYETNLRINNDFETTGTH